MAFFVDPSLIVHCEHNSDTLLDITCKSEWDNISLTRRYIENFLQTYMRLRKFACLIEIAACELMETVMRSSYTDGSLRLVVKKRKDSPTIELAMYNHTNSTNALDLIDVIDEMNKHDRFQYYIDQIKKTAKKNKKDSNEMRLSRIYFETRADIHAHYTNDNETLEVTAIFPYN